MSSNPSAAPVNATSIGGVAVSGTPAANKVIDGTSATAAAWTTYLDTTAGDITAIAAARVAGAVGQSSDAGHAHLYPELLAESTGTLAVTVPTRNLANANLAALTTAGQVAVNIIGLPKGLTVTHIQILFGSTGVNGPTHFWLALLDASLNVLAVSTDRGSGTQAQNAALTLTVTTDGVHPYVVAADGAYYVAVSSSASTTAPTLTGLNSTTSAGSLTPIPFGTAGTQAAPPAVGAQLASGTVTANANMNFAAWIS